MLLKRSIYIDFSNTATIVIAAANEEMLSARSRPSDIISNLPDNIIESILLCLSTRDAVKTSVLSKTWRYRWAKLPRLVLDEMFWDKSTVKHSDMSKVAVILNQIMLLHEGPIKKFTLDLRGREACPEIDNLIFFLSRKSIEVFKLIMAKKQNYTLPLSFFTCQQLRYLSLEGCLIETPPAVKGFSRLITLKLCRVTIMGKLLESLISSCPLLEVLQLLVTRLSDDHVVEVDAPNLKVFIFGGFANMFTFKNVPRLSRVVDILFDDSKVHLKRATYNLAKFFNDLPAMKKLGLSGCAIESLVAGKVPNRLLTTLPDLQELELIKIALDELNVLPFIIWLSRSFPNLKTMNIRFCLARDSESNAPLELLTEQGCSDLMLNRLEKVNVKVAGAMSEVELIKFLLAKSPNLKRMKITFYEQEEGHVYEMFKELTNFPRASTQAQVIYVEPQEYQTDRRSKAPCPY